MNLLLFKADELTDGIAVISDSRARHIIKVLKTEKGGLLKAGVINGPTGTARLTGISGDKLTMEFAAEGESPAAPDMSLIMALPRPKAFRRILFCAVSCGVKDIHIINSWRVEKSYWESPYIDSANVESVCLEALSQAKDTVMPAIRFHRFFTGFMEEGLPLIPEGRGRYLAHPYGAKTDRPKMPAAAAVGPEGGFIEREVETFAGNGFELYSAGERTLTTEHFVPFMLGSLLNNC